jgi:hypothetical protein
MRRFAKLALESLDTGAVEMTPPAEGGSDLEAPETLDAVLGEAQALDKDLDTAEASLEDLEDLGHLTEKVEDTLQEGGPGLTDDAAEIVGVAVEALLKRLKVSSDAKLVPSLEAFGRTESRVTSTRVALEGLKEKAQQAWETFKRFLEEIWQKILDFYHKFMGVHAQILKQAQALKEEIQKAGNLQPKTQELDLDAVYRAFGFKGNFSAQRVEELLDVQGVVTTQLAEGANFLAETYAHLAKTSMQEILAGKFESELFAGKVVRATRRAFNSIQGASAGMEKIMMGPYVNGKGLIIDFIKPDVDVTGIKARIELLDIVSTDKVQVKPCPILNRQAMLTLCDSVISMLAATEKAQKEFANNRALKELKSIMDSAWKKLFTESFSGKGDQNAMGTMMGDALVIQAVGSWVYTMFSRTAYYMPRFNLIAARQALHYVQTSFKEQEVKESIDGRALPAPAPA